VAGAKEGRVHELASLERAVGVQVENPSRRRREGAAGSRHREQGTDGWGQVHGH
jgi:hypothetical protein